MGNLKNKIMNALSEALENKLWVDHKIGDTYTMDGKTDLWKIAYYPIFEDGKTNQPYSEARALIEKPMIGGTDFREVPLRYLKKVYDKKESIYELQKFDCNCNDCKHLVRLLDKQNEVLSTDKATQEEIFYIVKDKKINDINDNIASLNKHKAVIKNVDHKIEKLTNKRKVKEQEK